VKCVFEAPQAAIAGRLTTFFQAASRKAPATDVAAAATAVDSLSAHLLPSLSDKGFWDAARSLSENGAEPQEAPDGSGYYYELLFEAVPDPYAGEFVKRLEGWLSALGVADLWVDQNALWSVQTGDNILDLAEACQQGRLALFLGAGVSLQYGLPHWGELLARLRTSWAVENNVGESLLAKIRSQELPQQARWLKAQFGSSYLDAVKLALYRDLTADESSLFTVIGRLSKTKGIRAICTYNYDDLLERTDKEAFASIAQAQDHFTTKAIPVYHVHGLLPFEGPPRGDLVLSEDDYHDLANDPLSWSNVVQINLLRECTCVLIGMSCTDPNLRRLLDLVGHGKAGDTYVIQRMDSLPAGEGGSVKAWSDSKEFDREQFASLQVKTVWIRSYDEVSLILQGCLQAA
jgi:hypothetical protein